jgi:hypothetical protein
MAALKSIRGHFEIEGGFLPAQMLAHHERVISQPGAE